MAKISSKYQRIFCGGVGAEINIAQFGSYKSGVPVYSTDPATIQALPAWEEGWSQAVVDNASPTIQDMNGLFYLFTRQIAYLLQKGLTEKKATTTYYTGSFIQDGIGNIFKSVTGDNINNSIFDEEKWMLYKSINSREVIANEEILNNDYSFVWPTGVTGPTQPYTILPTPAENVKGRKLLLTIFSGGFTQSEEIICSGSKWFTIQATIVS